MMLTFEEKYKAILNKDVTYEGSFITGVKSTNIFCRPSCTARKPKAENVIFFDTVQQALQHGYRPCKVCKPLEPLGETPSSITTALNMVKTSPYAKVKDYHLREAGIDPALVRRWFKKNHGITFHAYQRMIRINSAYHHLANGQQVTTTAFDSGYESLSGFNHSFQALFGAAPGRSQDQQPIIYITRFTTPLGPMFGCATDQGICLAEFTDRRMLETEFADLKKRLEAVIIPGNNIHLTQLKTQLNEYFSGQRHQFDLALHTPGTDFQQSVWGMLQSIPYGETRSYQQQADLLGNSKAVRAVATANGMNRVAIVIPCHRVVGSDGSLTGYAGGLPRKQWLLEHERTYKE